MIHLHNSLTTLADPFAAGSNKPAAAHTAVNSFRNALTDVTSPTPLPFSGDPNQGQVTGAPATTGDSGSTSASGGTFATEPYNPFAQAASNTWVGVPVSSPSDSSAATSGNNAASSANADPALAFDNAYWAQQPPAVQALRTMQDPEQRSAYAHQLASQGYTIDVPIMAWGWDPSLVTSMRQADGYTWVPSAMQSPVEVAPGLGAIGNLSAYDPKSPPAGSIAVS